MDSRRHALVASLLGSTLLVTVAVPVAAWQEATPETATTCNSVPSTTGTPVPQEPHDMTAHAASPEAAIEQRAVPLVQTYIDMMIPHHASIIAMAEAARPRLSDTRLREMAEEIIATQEPEIARLRELRQTIVGSPDPAPMDGPMLAAMHQMMPEMSGDMEAMAFQMDAAAQVAAICAAEDPDLAFIDQTIPHHQMAIDASQAVLEQSESAELREVAEAVIAAQQREIDELRIIRQRLAAVATP